MRVPTRRASAAESAPTRKKRRTSAIALATAGAVGFVGLGGLSATAAVAAPADPVTINLVTVNDFHGRIEKDTASGGAAALATAVNQIRATNPNTVFAAAGDLIGASTFTSFIQQDNPTIDALSAAGLDVSSVGNHEFDQGYDDLMNRVIPRASWAYIGANVLKADGSSALPEYYTKTFEGVTIGFVGAVTDELPSLVSPAGIAGLTVEPPVVAANRVANQLRDGNPANGEADFVVLLVHEGAATTSIASATDPASRFGQLVNGANSNISAIVSGHTHLAYNHVINNRPVISSGQYGEKFSNMVITVDPSTKAVLSMVNTTNDLMTKQPNGSFTPNFADDATVAPIVAAATTKANELGAAEVGTVTADFNRALQPGLNAQGQPANVENRGGESTIGNFVADVQLWSAQKRAATDIAFMNPGGIRTNIAYAPDGVVTYREAANVQPFANTLMTMKLTGAQVKAVLEQQWQPASSSRPFLKLGVNKELTYTYNPGGAAGSRITQILLKGAPIDPAASYSVVANSFLAAGGDNFTAFSAGTERADSGMVDLQSMVDWFAANKKATPDLKQRAVGVVLSAPDADGYGPGDALTISLSSLDFSTNETAAGTVNASIGGVAIGSAPVDRTLLTSFDEIGTATITTKIPDGVYGAQTLQISVPSTGTSVSVPITLNAKPAPTPTTGTSTGSATAGGTVTLTGSNLKPGAAVVVELRSTPVVVGKTTVAANGTFSVTVTVPANTATGAHSLVVLVDGVEFASHPLTVAAAATAGGGTTTTASATGSLAKTGVDASALSSSAVSAIVLLLAGGALVFARRRRANG